MIKSAARDLKHILTSIQGIGGINKRRALGGFHIDRHMPWCMAWCREGNNRLIAEYIENSNNFNDVEFV